MLEPESMAVKRGLVAPATVAATRRVRRRDELFLSVGWLAGSVFVATAISGRYWLGGAIASGILAASTCAKLAVGIIDDWLPRAELRRGVVHRAQSGVQQLNYGVELYDQGESQEALEVFRLAAAEGASSARAAAWLNVGLISEELGQPEVALTAWDQSLAASYGLSVREASELTSQELLVLASLDDSHYRTESQIQASTSLHRKRMREVIASLERRGVLESTSKNLIPRFRLARGRSGWRG